MDRSSWHISSMPPFPVSASILLIVTLLAAACAREVVQDVRFDPTPMPAVRAMLELAKVGSGDVVYDLGSGDGRIVITAAKEFGAHGIGIEIDSGLVAKARENARQAGVEDRVQFIHGNLFNANIQRATVVTLFLYDDVNLKLRPKLLSELKPGTRIVSYIWPMGDWQPIATREINNRTIYLWQIPESSQAKQYARSSTVVGEK